GAAVEVARPIAFARAIVIAVSLPLFAMSGIEGRMYQPLAAAVIAALAASLVLAMTVVPLASAALLRPRGEPAHEEDAWLVPQVKRRYAPLLDASLRHGAWVLVLAVMITLPALLLARVVGSDFMPRLDEGALLLQTMLPPEASLDEVDRLNHRVEDALRELPEVEDV